MNSCLRRGDVLVLPATGDRRLAVACDALGGIGSKRGDSVGVPAYVVGRFACRVPLMELLAVEAAPVAVSCCLCVEPDPTGREIMAGVRDELRAAALEGAVALTGSTEKNVATSQTAVGITVVGTVDRLRWGRARPGDVVLAVGEPKVGEAVSLENPTLADIPTLRLALAHPSSGDAVPVGSRGIAAEARDLALRSGLVLALDAGRDLDLETSAGPATVFLVTVAPGSRRVFERYLSGSGRPVQALGSLRRPPGRGTGPGAVPAPRPPEAAGGRPR